PAKDTAGQVGRDQKLDAGQAKRKTRTAKQLEDLPEAQAKLEEGEISEAHADALADARAKADARARAALGEHEAGLLAAAAKETPNQFRDRLARFLKEHSEDDGRSDFEKKKAARRLSVWRDKDGMTQLRGTFDPVSGQVIRNTLDRVAEQLFRRDHRNHPEDEAVPFVERTNEQRLADAMTEVCRRADQVDGPAKRGQDRGIVFLTLDDLLGRLDEAGIPSTLADGTPIPASVARRLACDAGLIPMVLGGDSVPLDEGRAKRNATLPQRTALGAQYATCMIGDCQAPLGWCDAHHIIPWDPQAGGGPTDLENLVPACDHCHDLAHTPGWTIEKLADGSVVTTAPDGTRWHRRPNGPAARRRGEPPSAAAPEPGSEPAATLFSEAA
ncbi:MAG TPA: DUF222 domain-containing protein, partial [Acidimicrobiales bacterium]|nr:DUF222 domain-containing protein [Acidimicrobiales bacterium]